nr:hypothetical protein [Streptomyces rochei]
MELSSDHSLVELSYTVRFGLCHEGVEAVDVLTLWILGVAGAMSVLMFTVRALLDQLTEVFAAWHRAKRAVRDRTGEDDHQS